MNFLEFQIALDNLIDRNPMQQSSDANNDLSNAVRAIDTLLSEQSVERARWVEAFSRALVALTLLADAESVTLLAVARHAVRTRGTGMPANGPDCAAMPSADAG